MLTIEVRREGIPLPYSVLHDRLQRVDHGEIAENKRLGNVLAFIQEKQAELSCERSKSAHPRGYYLYIVALKIPAQLSELALGCVFTSCLGTMSKRESK